MIQLYKMCNVPPRRVLAAAVGYFGPDGLDLERTGSTATSLTFEGGGGFVTVEALPSETGAAKSRVEISAREWEQHARRFLQNLDAANRRGSN
mgnify:CR=1 FL=1